MRDGVSEIPIEVRSGKEVSHLEGLTTDKAVTEVALVSPGSPTGNFAFDVTPARLVSGLITERGICAATEEAIASLFPASERH